MRTRSAVVGVCCLLVTLPAQAQTRMFVLQLEATSNPARLVEVNVDSGNTIRAFDLQFEHTAGPPGTPLAITADGRFVAWLGNASLSNRTLSALDRRTALAAPVRSLLPSRGPLSETYPHTLLAHPTEVRAFVVSDDVLLNIDVAGAHAMPLAGPLRDVLAISRDGSILLVERGAGLGVERVDSRTGASLGHVNLPQPAEWTMSPDGTAIYSLGYGSAGFYRIRRHDPISGDVLNERSWKIGTVGMVAGLAADPNTGRVFVGLFSGRYDVLDPVSLDRIGAIASTLSSTFSTGVVNTTLTFDPYQRRAYLLGSHTVSFPPGPDEAMIDVLDTGTLAQTGAFRVPPGARYMAIVPRPPTPTALSATTQGLRVTLTWDAGPGPGAASEYRVEAGSGPGLANLATLVTGSTPGLVVENVPAGTYYVRVHAVGTDAVSGPSNEVVVTVR